MATIESAGVMRLISAGFAAVVAASIFAVPVSAAPNTAASAAVVPPTDKVTVDVLTVNGSGCPAGTATTRVAPDNTGFHIAYSDFLVRDGSGSAATEFRKNCQVNLRIQVPQGFTYAIARADYRGRLLLPTGATALERTNYYFQGDADNNFVDHTFTGPLVGAWHATDTKTITELVYAPCGKTVNLNVNTELRVNSAANNKASWISLRSSDGDVDTLMQFSWLEC